MPPEYYAVCIEFGDPNSTTFVVLPSLHFSARSIQLRTRESVGQALPGRVMQVVILIFVVVLPHLTTEHLLVMAVALKTKQGCLETMAPIQVVQADTEGNIFYKAEIETQTIPDTVMDKPIGSSSNSLNDLSSNAATHQLIAPLAMEEPEVKTEPESISLAICPYPIRSKGHLPTSDPSESPSSSATTDTSLFELEYTHSSSCAFGYNLCDYRQRKVINKNATTSWYTYRTPGPLDSPPEFPPNSMWLEHNVIFLHINEAERAKLNEGQLSKLLKYCVRMWIWNGDSLRWERIDFGERRVVGDGYELAIALKYCKGISPEWVTPKAMKRILKALR
ncbi:hypothetical protein GG344DRAFT_82997 [Lentinula edodes]|nr:hypothetical protein GG344DRAFT_82997 [Lentinula edodes]